MNTPPTIRLADIAAALGCAAPSANPMLSGMSALADAGPDELSFISSEQYLPQFLATRAGAVLVKKTIKLPENHGRQVLVVDDPDLAQATVLALFALPSPRPPVGIDPTARIAPSAVLAESCAIGPNVVIGAGAVLGRGVVIHPGVCIGEQVVIGDDCELFPNVVLRERVTLGKRVIIHAGAVIGTDGFGYRWDGKQHAKIPQIGTVVIEDDVEVGSCACIDRAKFAATVIGRGTKIDNLVQIGHNVRVGPHCIIVGQAGIAGSARLGAGVVLGGQSAVRDHVQMGDGSMLAACSGVMEDVESKQIVSGLPALPHRQSLREQGALRQLPELRVLVRKLEERVADLEAKLK